MHNFSQDQRLSQDFRVGGLLGAVEFWEKCSRQTSLKYRRGTSVADYVAMVMLDHGAGGS